MQPNRTGYTFLPQRFYRELSDRFEAIQQLLSYHEHSEQKYPEFDCRLLITLILFLHHLESFSGDKYVPKKIVPKAASGTIGFDKNAVIISFLSASHEFHQAMFLRPKVLQELREPVLLFS